MTPELEVAINASKDRVIKFVMESFPDATHFTVFRESDWGEWYNSSPDVYDAEDNRLDGKGDSFEWNDSFAESASEDLNIWMNNAYGADSDYFTFSCETGERIPNPPEPPYTGSTKVNFGIYSQPIPEYVDKTVGQLKEEYIERWQMPSNVHAFVGGKVVDDDHVIHSSETIEFYRRMVEKGNG